MKSASLLAIVFAATTLWFTQDTKAASDTSAFDGTWAVTVNFHEYKNPDGTVAKGWVKYFPATIKSGVLHGELGTRGAPNWYELNGKIEADGTANLRVNGVTGNPGYTPDHPQPGLHFQYEVNAHFDGRHGTGQSVGDPPPPHAPRTRIYTFVKE
jgi:hypothetical protein